MGMLETYLATVLAAYIVQQGEDWYSLFSVERVLKAAAWPAILFRPLVARLGNEKNGGK